MYKTLTASKSDFDDQLNAHMQDGWTIHGGLTSHVIGSTAHLCVLLEKETQVTPPSPVARKRNGKNKDD